MTPEQAEIRLNAAIARMKELQERHERHALTGQSDPLPVTAPIIPRWLARLLGR